MRDTLKLYLRHTSWPIMLAMLALMAIGIAAIHACKGTYTGNTFTQRQTVFAVLGVIAFLAASSLPYQRLGAAAYTLFAGLLVMLVVVLFLPPINYAHRWVSLGPIQVQISEPAKLGYIIMLGWYLRYRDNYRRLAGLVLPFVLTFLPMGLILIEPDLGTSMLFLPTLYIVLFLAGAKIRHLLGIVAAATVLVLMPIPICQEQNPRLANLAYSIGPWRDLSVDGRSYVFVAAPLVKMEPHQVDRIAGWLRQNDDRFSRDFGYQLRQSKRVIGAGLVTGRGGWDDSDSYFRVLPENHTDFIFSVIAGQWGFIGCMVLLGLYVIIFVFGVEIAVATYDAFGRLLAVGVLAMLFSQLAINISMTMGLLPVTGLTLPLVSYGGSSLVTNCTALGLLVNVGMRMPIVLGRRPFEHGQGRTRQSSSYELLSDGSFRDKA